MDRGFLAVHVLHCIGAAFFCKINKIADETTDGRFAPVLLQCLLYFATINGNRFVVGAHHIIAAVATFGKFKCQSIVGTSSWSGPRETDLVDGNEQKAGLLHDQNSDFVHLSMCFFAGRSTIDN